ncbi:Fic family protein [Cyanobium sp. FGCU-6]|nr:Fic family protein [Cyanobium sp. FGCU6]
MFIHPVVRAIALHFWLACDHLFCDGNGRTARALFYRSMLKQGYWLFEFISISSVIDQARAMYERSFLLCGTDDNDLTYFLLAQVTVIQQAIANLHAYLSTATAKLALLRHAGFRYTVLSHQNSHGVSNQTARSDLQKLAGRGLLIPGKDGKREIFRVPTDLATRLPG